MAFRAPVLAALFLIVALATLAMPGSGNFIGEILILFGTFEDKLVYGLVASVGVVLAAVYMIRLYQRHDARPGRRRRWSRASIDRRRTWRRSCPLVAVDVALGAVPAVRACTARRRPRSDPRRPPSRQERLRRSSEIR